MAKAALNMLTRTSAAEYARDGIYMNSVDTGWVSNENPFEQRTKQQEQGFCPPLDVVDGMARLYDPIVRGLQEPDEPLFGLYLKDYASCSW
jgi:NAD(P)-dependent dehydrogenase (short-subunit alcohol dehydrogenase family)